MSAAAAAASQQASDAENYHPKIAKKDLSAEMSTGYNPVEVEKTWAQWWAGEGYFKPRSDADASAAAKDADGKFVIVLPPPNVTGRLHLGHGLTAAVQDTIVRFQRMKGKDALYLPGSDHAGIATQVVVEKRLMQQEGKSRHDLGRDKFLERVWEHKKQHSGFIHSQLSLLGVSCDWSRDRFTMDDKCGDAVREAFVQLHEQGKVYRATRLVNWCCALQSAISDLEVEFEDFEPKTKTSCPGYDRRVDMGQLVHFIYKVVDDPEGGELIAATTRPETIIGDVAIAVHPDDERYKKYHGKYVQCPFRDDKIPIITDPVLVDMAFGTGVVKITPAHDPNDFECGQRHNLPARSIMDLQGNITEPGPFLGMHRFACRWHIVDELKKKGLLKDVEGYSNRVPRCQRTRDIVEPMLMPQWFVDCREMAAKSLKAVETGELKLTPNYHDVTWKHFLGNIKPWCVSRQIWWGHRIPAYFVKIDGEPIPGASEEKSWIVARNLDEAKAKLKKAFPELSEEQLAKVTYDQDPDVLDTWFSSGLWPFSTMGWPEKTPDMDRFFPGSLLETGHDILFFWVARMVMMSFHFFNKVPFSEVFLHAMVRDKEGRKMSKSLGNVIDPVDVMVGISLEELHKKLEGGNLDPKEHKRAIQYQKDAFGKFKGIPECGSDALRFGLLSYTQSGRNVNLDIERIVGYRQFCNKLWNVTRYILYHALGGDNKIDAAAMPKLDPAERESYPLECRWILSRLDEAVEEAAKGMTPGSYDFHLATSSAYNFWLYELCDVFLELTKPVMATPGPRKVLTQAVLLHAVEAGLRMLHPMMPFVTEELYNRLPHHKSLPSESIMMAEYPVAQGWRDRGAEQQMALLNEMVHTLRSLKGQYNLTTKVQPDCWVVFADAAMRDTFKEQGSLIKTLAWVGNVAMVTKAEEEAVLPIGCAFAATTPEVGCHLSIKEHINPTKELEKMDKEVARLQKVRDGMTGKMSIPNYETKVPADVRAANITKCKDLEQEIQAQKDARAKMAILAEAVAKKE